MNRFKNHLLIALSLLALAAIITGVTAGSAVAQLIRAALVKNIDEPGRTPYQVAMSCGGVSGCTAFAKTPVPAGKRLVLENVSAFMTVDSFHDIGYTQLQGNSNFPSGIDGAIWPLQAQFVSSGLWIVNSPVRAFYSAGETPNYVVSGTAGSTSVGVVGTFTGYLVDLSL